MVYFDGNNTSSISYMPSRASFSTAGASPQTEEQLAATQQALNLENRLKIIEIEYRQAIRDGNTGVANNRLTHRQILERSALPDRLLEEDAFFRMQTPSERLSARTFSIEALKAHFANRGFEQWVQNALIENRSLSINLMQDGMTMEDLASLVDEVSAKMDNSVKGSKMDLAKRLLVILEPLEHILKRF